MKKVLLQFLRRPLALMSLLLATAVVSQAQTIEMSMANCTTTANELQFDYFVKNTGTSNLRWSGCVLRIDIPDAAFPVGTALTNQSVKAYYLGGSDFPASFPTTGYGATSPGWNFATTTKVTTIASPSSAAYNNTNCPTSTAPLVLPGETKKIGRFSARFEIANFVAGSNATVSWVSTSSCNFYVECAGSATGFATTTVRTLLAPCAMSIPSACSVTGTATTTPVSCFGQTNGTAQVTLTGSTGGGTYTVDGGSAVPYAGSPFSITGLSAGNHTVVATQTSGGCVSSDIVFNVATPANFAATYAKNNLSSCAALPDGSITVTPTGGVEPYTYTWSGLTGPGATVPFTAGNVPSVTGLNYGYYNVTVSDANGCGSATFNNIHVQFAYSVFITNSGTQPSSCANDGSITLYGNSGNQPYMYSLDAGAYQSSNVFTGLAAGTYLANVKDATGCVSSKSITLTASAPLVISPFVRAASSCNNDGSIEIYRSGGVPTYTYSLNGSPYTSNNKFLNLAPGTYTAAVKDARGCVTSQSVIVGQGAALNVTAIKSNTSTCVNDGVIVVTATGGVPGYTYSLDNISYQASNTFTGLGAANYTVYAKDAKGCVGQFNISIATNPIVVTAAVINATACAVNNGSIQIFRVGGTGPYTYSIDGNNYQSSQTFSGLLPGTYTCYVKDSKNCIGTVAGIVVGPTGCGGLMARVAVTEVPATTVKVQAYPNPSADRFNVRLDGFNMNQPISIVVTNAMGVKVFQTTGTGKMIYNFGANFKAGTYHVQVIQGDERKSVTLVKE